MKRLLLITTALAGCDARDYRALTELGAVTARVDIDVGVPQRPQSPDNYGTGMTFDVTYSAPGCFTLDDPEARLDGRAPDYVIEGWYESHEVHGSHEEYCVTPSFYLDALPAPQALSVLTLADDSTELSMAVDRLLVNPALELGALRPGPVLARVDDNRAIARAHVWWRGDFNDPNRQDWEADATVGVGEIGFSIPTYLRGAGTFGIELAIEQHQIDCVGFVTCSVLTRGGASFERTIQP